jgi:hypothetical protein
MEAIVMTKLRGLVIGVVFLVGCAVGGAAGRFVVPSASAQQAATLTKWEYLCFDEGEGQQVAVKATQAGGQGWEMVTVGGRPQNWTWCFKRPRL